MITGHFRASFNENSPSGKSEGSVPLAYTPPRSLDGSIQNSPHGRPGFVAITVSGSDANGNLGSTYGWLYVGLNMLLQTDSPTYVLGDTMSIS